MSIVTAVSLLLLMAALATDLKSKTIPNRLTLPFFVTAILYHAVIGGYVGVWTAVCGAAAGFIPLLLLYWMGGIGAGDVKLFGAVGCWIGVAAVLQLIAASIVFAGFIGLLLVALRRIPLEAARKTASFMIVAADDARAGDEEPRSRSRYRSARLRMPFMIAVVPGVVAIWPSLP